MPPPTRSPTFVLAAAIIRNVDIAIVDGKWKRWKREHLGDENAIVHEPDVRRFNPPFRGPGEAAVAKLADIIEDLVTRRGQRADTVARDAEQSARDDERWRRDRRSVTYEALSTFLIRERSANNLSGPETAADLRKQALTWRAGDRNRTGVLSLEG